MEEPLILIIIVTGSLTINFVIINAGTLSVMCSWVLGMEQWPSLIHRILVCNTPFFGLNGSVQFSLIM